MANNKKATFSVGGIAVAALVLLANWWLDLGLLGGKGETPRDAGSPGQSAPVAPAGPGFTSERSLKQHFEKHGHEFGVKTAAEYLAIARQLRDATVGPRVLEERRRDGVITRFDRDTGAFVAVNADRTIRTLFKPDDGERYFRRQAKRDD